MVLYKVKSDYFPGVLKTLNCLRLNKEFYDVVLTVGDKQIYTHKNILISGSDYFKTMFVGPYKETSMAEIDLSATTSDSETLENIVNFLYTGELEINFENFGPLMKLASAFLVSELHNFCMDFFLDNLKFSTYLDFYFSSIAYSLVELEGKLEMMVKSRFHDKLILMDKTQNLTSEELSQLFRIGCFKYCSTCNTLTFIIDWLENELSERRLSVANEMLGSVVMKGQELTKEQKSDLTGAMKRLSTNHDLTTSDLGKLFLSKLEDSLLPVQKITVVQPPYGPQSKVKQQQEDLSPDSKDLIITISPQQKVVDEHFISVSGEYGRFDLELDGSVLDICAYELKTKAWHYLYSLDDIDIAGAFLRRLCDSPWEYVYKDSKVFCSVHDDSGWHDIDCLEFGDFSCVGYYDKDIAGSTGCNTRLVSAAEHSVYSVCIVRHEDWVENKEVNECYFKVHKLTSEKEAIDDYDKAILIFRAILVFSSPKFQYTERGWHKACISCISDEMIIVYYNRRQIVRSFVADLKADQPDLQQIYARKEDSQKQDDEVKTGHVEILPGKDRFYIIQVGKEQNNSRKLSCQYEYVYNSGALTQSNVSSVYVKSYIDTFDEEKYTYTPIFYDAIKGDNGSIWMFSGNREGASSLSEVTVDETGQFCVLEHKPPPFSSITGLFSAQLSTEYLSDKKLIRKFRQGISLRPVETD